MHSAASLTKPDGNGGVVHQHHRVTVVGRGHRGHHTNTLSTALLIADKDILLVIFVRWNIVATRVSTVGAYIGRYFPADRLHSWQSSDRPFVVHGQHDSACSTGSSWSEDVL